ncbi:DUF2442 domain-containing protein [uncultured Maricaulis sp.]|uniref:DUF2442 domain-containing protein n=1 Tax=uncultured Maricaulis sp. TaxID=174710 RepID=UPI0030D9846A|tara:strand:+ start:158257 stop:158526 length:270 start_codon:yes stop_codon:yes gene_type:complete
MIKIASIKALADHRLKLVFSDGSCGTADLSALVKRAGEMVQPLRDQAYFARVFLEAGAPTWPNGFDLAPWALHRDLDAAGLLDKSGQLA